MRIDTNAQHPASFKKLFRYNRSNSAEPLEQAPVLELLQVPSFFYQLRLILSQKKKQLLLDLFVLEKGACMILVH
jgi:hypothetical protein